MDFFREFGRDVGDLVEDIGARLRGENAERRREDRELERQDENLISTETDSGRSRPLVNKGTQGILELTGKTLFDKSKEEWDHRIWIGGFPTARGRQWVFGQFDDAVLPATILMLERSGLKHEQRGDPVLVSRAVSKMVNSNDDNGVLIGRWDGNYDEGVAPSKWSGSIKIMEEYLSKGSSVKYGQCWVFSGVATTVCRAIGIPCRSVSNMNSAHDTNMSLTIDKYFNEEGEEFDIGRQLLTKKPGKVTDEDYFAKDREDCTAEYKAKEGNKSRKSSLFTLPLEARTLQLSVSLNDYYDKLVEYAMIKLTALATVEETTQTWVDEDTFQILKPSIKVDVSGKGFVGKPLLVKFSFKNPLDISLRNCTLVVDGPGLTRPKSIPIKNVGPSELMEYELTIYPKRAGSRSLIATFNSVQLVDLTGSTSVDIIE
ncbi:Hemocyte protein-glutamine gamma-glutamyltransferase [Armadillidium nasatum]|uniref:Hemocyte protein-glutamine gamma-glutamyltransferase n=1 Tax=Armadillidium nasatum TaxID=96803 RepID=A0A5N5SXS2_9CRUS|nr:Hemocyte protein-glutamine gamma-glutamyltransferase [Armadillidium nasatum]